MVLMYHNVATEPLFYSSSTEELVEQMEVLHARRMQVVPVDLYLDGLEGRAQVARPVALTFDDAYASFAERALPVLERFGYPATVFVPTGHTGGFNCWDPAADPEHFRIMDAETLRELARHPLVTIGSHGVSHRSLGGVDGEQLEREICDSKRTLDHELGIEARLFAFPYGQRHDVPPGSRAVLARCGYRAAFTTEWTRHPDPANVYALGRLEITAGDHAARFTRKLFGKLDTWSLRQTARTFKHHFLR